MAERPTGRRRRGRSQGSGAPTQSPGTSAPRPPVTDAELAALDALGARGIWDLQGHELSLTNLDKVLFPGRDDRAPVTKRDLVRYHAQVAPVMLPYLVDRPVNLHRYPNGVDRPGFWHKELPSYAPEWVRRWRNADAGPGETEWYAVVDSPPALAWMANYGAVELHPWTSRIGDVRRPTWAFIDIDPGLDTTFDEVLALARLFRTALDHLGVRGLPKVTGQRGVQIWIPDRRPLHLRRDESVGRERVTRGGSDRARSGQLGMGQEGPRRPGPPRLHAERHQQDARRSVQRPARPAHRCRCRSSGTSSTIPSCVPTAGPCGTVLGRIASVGDPFARLLTAPQELPSL